MIISVFFSILYSKNFSKWKKMFFFKNSNFSHLNKLRHCIPSFLLPLRILLRHSLRLQMSHSHSIPIAIWSSLNSLSNRLNVMLNGSNRLQFRASRSLRRFLSFSESFFQVLRQFLIFLQLILSSRVRISRFFTDFDLFRVGFHAKKLFFDRFLDFFAFRLWFERFRRNFRVRRELERTEIFETWCWRFFDSDSVVQYGFRVRDGRFELKIDLFDEFEFPALPFAETLHHTTHNRPLRQLQPQLFPQRFRQIWRLPQRLQKHEKTPGVGSEEIGKFTTTKNNLHIFLFFSD